MISTLVSLAFLGIASIDPIGIAVMPILLVQRRPYFRSVTFLLGGFFSLVILGFFVALGFGRIILRIEANSSNLIPYIEIILGAVLLMVAGIIYISLKRNKLSTKPPKLVEKWLTLNGLQLFVSGFLLVGVQSLLDVVFIVAMIHVGKKNLSIPNLMLALIVYAISALLIQIAVVVVYRFTPKKQRTALVEQIQSLLNKYSYQSVMIVGVALALVLFILGFRSMS